MSRVRPIHIIVSLSGKVCEHSDMYFRTNRQTQAVYTGKICHRSDTPLSEAQVLQQQRFAKISSAVDTLLADATERKKWHAKYLKQHKIGTLRGFVFAQINHLYDKNGDLI